MPKRSVAFSAGLMLVLTLSILFQANDASQAQEGTITLLSAQDQITLLYHDNLDADWLPLLRPGATGRSLLVAAVDQARAQAQRLMLVYLGSAPSRMDAPLQDIIQLMNASGYDLSAFGAYELSQGEATLAEAVMSARFPHLASNLELGNGALAGLIRPFGSTTLESVRAGANGGRIYDGLLVDVAGLNVCFFGLIDPGVSYTYKTSAVSAAAQRLVQTCKANQSELIVGLLHRSPAASLDRYDLSGVDVLIIGGADEALSAQAGLNADVKETSKSLWVQLSGQTRALGKLDLSVSDGQVSTFRHDLLALPSQFVGVQPQTTPHAAPSPWWIVAFSVGVLVAALFFLAHKP